MLLLAQEISGGSPPKVGVYIAYVDDDDQKLFAKRMFLYWGNRWSYPGSDQNFRGHVYGWIGPLPALRLDK